MIAAVSERVGFFVAHDVFDRNIKFLAKIGAVFNRRLVDSFEVRLIFAVVFAHFKLNVRRVVVV